MEHQFELTANVLDLEKDKDAQAVEMLKLRKYRQVESSYDNLNKEDASKKERSRMTRQSQLEKKYPLIKELLEKMLNLQLEAEEESTMAFELIKFIKSMLEE
ncbi:hypothetical protein Tco_0319663 [Tanacetum coccineum]